MDGKLSQGPFGGSDARVGAGLARGPNRQSKLVEAPWAATWPAPQSTLDLDFVNNRGWVRGYGQGGVMDALTFTRASTGTYVDRSGLLATASSGVWRQDWASTATVAQVNLLTYTEQFDNAYWNKANVTATASVLTETTSTGFHNVQSNYANDGVSRTWVVSVEVKANGRNFAYIDEGSIAGAIFTVNLTNGDVNLLGAAWTSVTVTDAGSGWYRVVGIITRATSLFRYRIGSALDASTISYAGDATKGIQVRNAQLEIGSTPSAYQAVAQPTTNTPLAANPTANGILIEESRTNQLLWCRDATQTNWTKTNCTAAKDQTGIDGAANAASSLTATAPNATCIQTWTQASGSRTGSVYLKRISGTGNVQVTLDGTTWSTVDLSNGQWNRIVLTGTVTNPAVGVLIATSGDAVAMDFAQVETGAFVTSPILTTTASATRSADIADVNNAYFATWFNNFEGTFVVKPVIGAKDASRLATNPSPRLFSTLSIGNPIEMFSNSTSYNVGWYLSQDAGVTTTPGVTGAMAYKSTYNAISAGGGTANERNAAQWSRLQTGLRVGGSANAGASGLPISRITYIPKAVSARALQALSGSST